MGLLPVIAHGLQVSVPKAGGLVTAYAVGVMLGAPVITLLMARFRRKLALILLMGLYVAGNLLSAVSGSYELLFASRVLTSLAHGRFSALGPWRRLCLSRRPAGRVQWRPCSWGSRSRTSSAFRR